MQGVRRKPELVVALDTETPGDAFALSLKLGDSVRCYKLGHHLSLSQEFSRLIDALTDDKTVFIDFKLVDIPQTVKACIKRAADRGITYVTVWEAALEAAVDAAQGTDVKVLAVPVLSSDCRNEDDEGWLRSETRMLKNMGAHGVIIPAFIDVSEAATGLVVAMPGIRRYTSDATRGDHAMTETPQQAVVNGADFLIVGRPIVRDTDPLKIVQEIQSCIDEAWACICHDTDHTKE